MRLRGARHAASISAETRSRHQATKRPQDKLPLDCSVLTHARPHLSH